MIISYQGGESFRISQGELALELNPSNKRFKSDISLYSTGHPEEETGSFTISGPGEYEVKGVTIKGFPSEAKSKINTIYLISFEGMNLCFFGPLFKAELPTETLEALEDIDILFVPIGGKDVLDPVSAYKLAVSLEPGIIIPMHYTKAELDQFIKESGEGKSEALEKLVIKKKDLEDKESEIVVLKEE